MNTTEQKILELPNYAAMYFGVERMRTYPEIDCGHDGAGFDSDDLKALAASYREMAKTAEWLTEFIESSAMVHFTKNGTHCVIYQDVDTFTLFGKFGESKGHTHILDALAAFEAIEGEANDK